MTKVMKAGSTGWRTALTMDITATDPMAAAHDASEVGLVESPRAENLNVEIVTSNPLLPTDRKWAIRFNAGGTVTIILGMKDYGRGWFSAYFAGLAAARLGIPFPRFRVYYSATLPAVLQTPVPSPSVFHRRHIGPMANAIADAIEGMCDQVIEKGRSAFAALAGVGAIDVGFDRQTGRFFVLERDRSGNIFEIAEATRGGSSAPIAFARKLRRGGKRVIAEESQAPSAAWLCSLTSVW
jgi:CO/xanthine dehydrogenase Mo-binding subunit